MDRWCKPQFVALALWALLAIVAPVAIVAPAAMAVCDAGSHCHFAAPVASCHCPCVHSAGGNASNGGMMCCKPRPPLPTHSQLQAISAPTNNAALLAQLSHDAGHFHIVAHLPAPPSSLATAASQSIGAGDDTLLSTQHAPATWPSRAPPLL
jgi:hypothetical protein